MLFNNVYLDRPEGADADMQGHISYAHSFVARLLKEFLRKVKTGCRSCNRAVYPAVDSLVHLLVTVFSGPCYIRRQRHRSDIFKYLHEYAVIAELHESRPVFRIMISKNPCLQNSTSTAFKQYGISLMQSFARSYHAFPAVAFYALYQEHLYMRSCALFCAVHSRRDDP